MALKFIEKGLTWMVDGEPVPQRTLTDEEVEKWGGEEALLASGLYRPLPKAAERAKDEVKENGD